MITIETAQEYFEHCDVAKGLIWKTRPGVTARVKVGDVAGYIDEEGYRRIKWRGSAYYAHRIVWLLHNGYWPTHQVDHINGIRSDNRIDNLRASNPLLNQRNRASHRSGRLVGARKSGKRWISTGRINKKKCHFGTFDTEREAHEAYLAAVDRSGKE